MGIVDLLRFSGIGDTGDVDFSPTGFLVIDFDLPMSRLPGVLEEINSLAISLRIFCSSISLVSISKSISILCISP